MRFFYDTEFIEDGRIIDLISIGIVREDGREYYAVNRDAPWKRIFKHDWLMENVVMSLPHNGGDERMAYGFQLTFTDPVFKTHGKIRADVKEFLLGPFGDEPRDVDLWAWYGAYDHVALAQLFGPMIRLPRGIPMWTNDLRQECHRLGLDGEAIAPREGGRHNALEDARWNRALHAAIVREVTGE